jgi:hypothetical protein
MDDEYIYARVWYDKCPTCGRFMTELELEFLGVTHEMAVIGCRKSERDKYMEQHEKLGNSADFIFRDWFLVRACDVLSRDDIAEAVKYG